MAIRLGATARPIIPLIIREPAPVRPTIPLRKPVVRPTIVLAPSDGSRLDMTL